MLQRDKDKGDDDDDDVLQHNLPSVSLKRTVSCGTTASLDRNDRNCTLRMSWVSIGRRRRRRKKRRKEGEGRRRRRRRKKKEERARRRKAFRGGEKGLVDVSMRMLI